MSCGSGRTTEHALLTPHSLRTLIGSECSGLNHDPVFATRALQQAEVLAHVDERFIEFKSSLPSFTVTLADYEAWKAKTNVPQDSQVS